VIMLVLLPPNWCHVLTGSASGGKPGFAEASYVLCCAVLCCAVPQVGSQHRAKAEPAGAVTGDKWVPKEGHTTLTSPPNKPFCRDLTDAPPAQPAA
jgi:hypothetical protein